MTAVSIFGTRLNYQVLGDHYYNGEQVMTPCPLYSIPSGFSVSLPSLTPICSILFGYQHSYFILSRHLVAFFYIVK